MKIIICVFIQCIIAINAEITVATYNIWNVMFNWSIRKYRISRLIKDIDADVIALQEVRAKSPTEGQLNDLQSILPQYRYSAFAIATDILPPEGSFISDGEHEGTGLLSKHPITQLSIQNLTYTNGPDKNRRNVLHVVVEHPTAGRLHVAVVHLSYDRRQQCENMLEILTHFKDVDEDNLILLGDFNIYANHDWPVRMLTESISMTTINQHCMLRRQSKQIDTQIENKMGHFKDVWLESHGNNDKGLTFSNMPEPGMQSRPDRIFVSENIQVLSSSLSGDGRVYKERFFSNIVMHRVWTTVGAMYASLRGSTGTGCVHDCGPHASCRCGLCVAGGDKHKCALPNCEECSSQLFAMFVISVLIIAVIMGFVIYSMLRVLQTMNRRSHKNCLNLPCCDWFCLCDANMCIGPPTRGFKSKGLRSIPPMICLFLSCLALFIFSEFVLLTFDETINTVYAIIPEELYPSDHLMLSVKV